MEFKPKQDLACSPTTSRGVARMKMDYITKFGPLNFTASKQAQPNPAADDYYLHILEKQISIPFTLTHRSTTQFRKLEDEIFGLNPTSVIASSGTGEKTLHVTFVTETKDRPFPCHICPKSFTAQRTLTLHLRQHEGESSPSPYTCPTCEKTFMQKSNLDRHCLIHYGIQSYRCDQCDRSFTQKSGLTRHLASHAGLKEFSCMECGKQFTRRATLYTHLLTRHLREKPFHCKECDAYFTSAANYRTHTRRIHSTEPLRYQCDMCDKKFFNNGDLKRHLRVHTGEKPFVCKVCNKAWQQSNGLKRHLAKFH